MKRIIVLLAISLVVSNSSPGQESRLDIADKYLSSNFKIFYSVDTELAGCMAPILEERIVSELKDSGSFYFPYDSLAKYVTIRFSEDSILKTFSWDRKSGGSWHDMASYVQYKSGSGNIKHQRLDSGDEPLTGEPTDVLIYKIHTIELGRTPHYLLLGWGTHGAGKHHSLARVYKVSGDSLLMCENIFQGQKYLYAGANRMDKIDLKFDAITKTLSYNHYEFDDDNGFYKGNGKRETWILQDEMFVEQW